MAVLEEVQRAAAGAVATGGGDRAAEQRGGRTRPPGSPPEKISNMDDEERKQQLYQGGTSFLTPVITRPRFVPPPDLSARGAAMCRAYSAGTERSMESVHDIILSLEGTFMTVSVTNYTLIEVVFVVCRSWFLRRRQATGIMRNAATLETMRNVANI
ncbi:unnamed protein product [Miscanthus lutarioriparius]|uniref:Uncharacterized protein n=1 Tax=Miscanthus lutarioriparius TaxID=422564 RepID=A0A811MSR6_9POAL|nr:unnamed protein product [Miscanthus lutarioriparius]